MSVWTHGHKSVCVYMCMYVCTHVYMFVHASMFACEYASAPCAFAYPSFYTCMHIIRRHVPTTDDALCIPRKCGCQVRNTSFRQKLHSTNKDCELKLTMPEL